MKPLSSLNGLTMIVRCVGHLVQGDDIGELDLFDQQVDQGAFVFGTGDLATIPQKVMA